MITIKQSKCADTRTCDWSKVSKGELLENSEMHINDIRQGILFFVDKLRHAAVVHDLTKLTNIDEFHNDFRTGFKQTEWWKMHQQIERHHLKDSKYVQDDVNLIDILDMITDGVMAGMARSGEYRQEEIPDALLRKAFDNTVKLLLGEVKVEAS